MIDKEKGKTGDLRKLSRQDEICFLLCKFVQACKLDWSMIAILFYCDKTSVRNYSPLIHSRFIRTSLKYHSRFVLMTETCKTKSLKIESWVSYQPNRIITSCVPKRPAHVETSFTLAGKISTLEGRKVKNWFLSDNVEKSSKCFQLAMFSRWVKPLSPWLTFRNVLFERAISLVDHFTGQYSSLNLIGVT